MQKAGQTHEEIQDIKKTLDEGKKDMKGIALRLCQWEDDLLLYQGKIWIPNNKGLRTTLIAKHDDPPRTGHGRMAKTTALISR